MEADRYIPSELNVSPGMLSIRRVFCVCVDAAKPFGAQTFVGVLVSARRRVLVRSCRHSWLLRISYNPDSATSSNNCGVSMLYRGSPNESTDVGRRCCINFHSIIQRLQPPTSVWWPAARLGVDRCLMQRLLSQRALEASVGRVGSYQPSSC